MFILNPSEICLPKMEKAPLAVDAFTKDKAKGIGLGSLKVQENAKRIVESNQCGTGATLLWGLWK